MLWIDEDKPVASKVVLVKNIFFFAPWKKHHRPSSVLLSRILHWKEHKLHSSWIWFQEKLVSVQCFKSCKYLFPGKENHRDNSNFQIANEATRFPCTVILIAQLFPEPIFFPFSRSVYVCVLASSYVSPTLWFLYELLRIVLWRRHGRNKPFSSHTHINAGPTWVPLDSSRLCPVNLLCLHHYSQTTFEEYDNPHPHLKAHQNNTIWKTFFLCTVYTFIGSNWYILKYVWHESALPGSFPEFISKPTSIL